ncbi:RNA polymerase sigma factor [Lysinibacter cavernae]|uniref:RNA polymerase sigma factor (Sigma-70 family) n=1 Tax=Lysinibacter cavernae TaxID=1640652 RepID=A0A7X5R2M8_9MICO|nr:sigma-70 family RNA polymerase sigma factor [Lysinibacter cavernae]NIH54524.1 RNA polymerase sigma factor (sigma-70 family) [Lysinibacter cavernae]
MDSTSTAAGDRESEFIARFVERMNPLLRFAKSVTSDPFVAEDLLSEVFMSTLRAVRGGKGPAPETFEAYMRSAIRNAAVKCAKAQEQVTSVSEPGELADLRLPQYSPDTAAETWDADTIRRAFQALPVRDQQVLYLSEVEQMSQADIAVNLELRQNTVAVIAHRAKALLRTNYLEQTAENLPACPAISHARLAGLVAGTLPPKRKERATEHLKTCATCARAVRHMSSFRVPVAVLVGIAITGSSAFAAVGSGAQGSLASAHAGQSVPSAVFRKITHPTVILAVAACAGVVLLPSLGSSTAGPVAPTHKPSATETLSTPANVAAAPASGEPATRCYAPADVLQRSGSIPTLTWSAAESHRAGATGIERVLNVTNIAAERRVPYSLEFIPAQGTSVSSTPGDCTQNGSNLICVIDGAALDADRFDLSVTVSAVSGAMPRTPSVLYRPAP